MATTFTYNALHVQARKLFFLLWIASLSLLSFSQQKSIDARNYTLNNGLKVVLCRDAEKPEITGAICVDVGSIHDPADATGMAHYFEHIMFKGTDKIGTLNWEEEKIYLDSITWYYDKLHETQDSKAREAIQLKINGLSQIAAQYAVPNETDVILSKMGGKGVNAGTGFENTVYFNSFPANQLHNWLLVYSERFRNPVFRLFQSELEAVYEEKNMYQDSPGSSFIESALKETFGEHPYGRPIIGYTEHLKNPQISKMKTFFDTYYVPNNMTLILVGDLQFDVTMEMIEETFGGFAYKEIPAFPKYNFPVFDTPTIVESRQTPIKVGVLCFETVSVAHQDNVYFDIILQLLSNESETGLLDKIMRNSDLWGAMPMPLHLKEHGVLVFFYVPKILGQSHADAEQKILACIDSLKSGNFSDELFDAVKVEYLTNEIRNAEGSANIFELILDYTTSGKNFEEYYSDLEKIRNMTKEDIMKIANKYFGNNYLSCRSKMGSAKKDKISKPNWKPVAIQNTDAQSEFAKMIASNHVESLQPQIIDFQKDVTVNESNSLYKFYSVTNPYNDIFTLKIYYHHGVFCNKHLANAATYVNMQGTKELSFQEFGIKLQLLGAKVEMTTQEDVSYIEISGFDKDFAEIIGLCKEKFFNTGNDEKILKVLLEDHNGDLKMDKKDGATSARALLDYALYGENSRFLRKPTAAEIKKYSGEELINYVNEIFTYSGFVTYSGNLEHDFIYKTLIDNNFISEDGTGKNTSKCMIPVEKTFTDDAVFFVHDSKYRQSNIYFYVPGIQMIGRDKNKITSKCFNQYFCGDNDLNMYSIVFQEIRELRSLGYAVYSRFGYDYLDRKPSCLFGFLGTQSDKTIDGIDAMHALITDMPQKADKFNVAKESLLTLEKSDYVGFRELPYQVYRWRAEGYETSPKEDIIKTIENTDFDTVIDFYNKTIKDKPVIITFSGNMKKVNKKELSKFGKVNQVKLSQVFGE